MTETPHTSTSGGGGDQEADRRVKLQRLRRELGTDGYGKRTDGLISLAEARSRYDKAADESHKNDANTDNRPRIAVAGRIVLHRDIGKLVFATLRDATGDLQIGVSQKNVDDKTMKLAKLADLGDVVIVRGPLGATKTGEITVWADGDTGFQPACKSLVPAPEKYHGLQDPELRYRRRYVDLYANPDVMRTLAARSRIVQRVREFLSNPPGDLGPGYLEVETPMMQPIPGGAAAKPFITHHNALDIDLYLRVAPELYLKRLLVGGMWRVFEINRNFRNEGIDRSHNPEFTMLELYQAFGDYHTMMELTEHLLHTLAVEFASTPSPFKGEDRGEGGTSDELQPSNPHPNPLPERERGPVLPYGQHSINFALPFRRAKYHDLFAEHNGFPASDHAKLLDKAKQLHVENAEKMDHDVLLNEVWERTVEHHLIQPTFVMDYPASLCPLTRPKPDNPGVAERFELLISGMEIANAYTELNDPQVQEEKFRQQLAGTNDEEATFRTLDMDFLEALKVGMPPAGGLGVGIDRVAMLLTNQHSIRDVILFPLLRPQST